MEKTQRFLFKNKQDTEIQRNLNKIQRKIMKFTSVEALKNFPFFRKRPNFCFKQ